MKNRNYTGLVAVTLIGLTTFGLSGQAKACAGCLDVFPEVVVLDGATQVAVTQNAPTLLQGKDVRLSEMSCVLPGLWAEDRTASCHISGAYESDLADFEVEFTGLGALVMYHQLRNLTVEPDSSVSDEWVRDGSRIKAALVSDTEESSTVTIPSIHGGTLSCLQVRGKARCEIELNVLNAVLYSYPE